MAEKDNHQFPKALNISVKRAVSADKPWSVTINSLHNVYGVSSSINIVDFGYATAATRREIVFLCSDLPSSQQPMFLSNIDIEALSLTKDASLYVCPVGLNWVAPGEQYRRLLGSKHFQGYYFNLVLVSYRDEEARLQNWEYVNFIEWHFQKRGRPKS